MNPFRPYTERFRIFCWITFFSGLIALTADAGSGNFSRLNSGTRADIIDFRESFDGHLFFLTGKIFRLNGSGWEKMHLPGTGNITHFYPVDSNDIWYSIDQVNNTSILYHYLDGKTQIIDIPFVNHISTICFTGKNIAWFSSISDIASYRDGVFTLMPPAPTRTGIIKIIPVTGSNYYCLSYEGELFYFHDGIYETVTGKDGAADICMDSGRDFFILTNDFIGKLQGSKITKLVSMPLTSIAKAIRPYGRDSLLIAGSLGSLWCFHSGKLKSVPLPGQENLKGVHIDDRYGIWLFGEKGRIFYSGTRHFPDYKEENRGFSAAKLIFYGVNIDDEYGVAMNDFTGDRKPDIYAVRIFEQNRLYINNINSNTLITPLRSFSEEAAQRNALGMINPKTRNALGELKLGIAVADVDNDGDRDIYLCYLNSNNRLLLNNGKGVFRNVSDQKNRACADLHRSNAAAFADVDRDGDLDLFVTSEEGSNKLYVNDGSGCFRDVTVSAGLSSTGGGMCASFADIDSDGLPDLCVTFWYPRNRLYKNESAPGKIFFREITPLTDLAKVPAAKSNGVAFADVNNDGRPDLFIANRNSGNRLFINTGKGIFRDSTEKWLPAQNMMTNGVVFADFDLDGYLDLYLTNVGENVFYHNEGGQVFCDETAMFGADLSGYCTGCAVGDVDSDGDPDLYVANYINGNSQLFLNITDRKSCIRFRLQGVNANRDGIGAKIWLYKYVGDSRGNALAGYREITSGSGYGSVSDFEQIFGVEESAVYMAHILFPGSKDTIKIPGLKSGASLDINEMDGFRALIRQNQKNATRFFTDSENQPEIFKYLAIALVLILYNVRFRDGSRRISIFRRTGSLVILAIFILINQYYIFAGLSFRFFIAPAVSLGLLVILHLIIGRVLLRRMAEKEKLELREKLSRDLHDDLASTLGSISIYANTLSGIRDSMAPDFRRLSGKVVSLTQSALQSISDIIWMTSPRNDSLQSLISKTSNYMFEILTDNHIGFETSVNIPDEPVILRENLRNDSFLICKEALHNIIRHSKATRVEFYAVVSGHDCHIRVNDNGIGMEPDKITPQPGSSRGNGLENMKRRSRESGIAFEIFSEKNQGTKISLKFRI